MENNLYNEVISRTGLDNSDISNEFTNLLKKNSLDPDCLTIEQLREVMAEYLQDVFLEISER